MSFLRSFGPLTYLFSDFDGIVVAAVLDQALIVGNMEQTVGMLAESTGFNKRYVKDALKRLYDAGLVSKIRHKGRTRAYRFNVEHQLRELVIFMDNLQMRRRKQ